VTAVATQAVAPLHLVAVVAGDVRASLGRAVVHGRGVEDGPRLVMVVRSFVEKTGNNTSRGVESLPGHIEFGHGGDVVADLRPGLDRDGQQLDIGDTVDVLALVFDNGIVETGAVRTVTPDTGGVLTVAPASYGVVVTDVAVDGGGCIDLAVGAGITVGRPLQAGAAGVDAAAVIRRIPVNGHDMGGVCLSIRRVAVATGTGVASEGASPSRAGLVGWRRRAVAVAVTGVAGLACALPTDGAEAGRTVDVVGQGVAVTFATLEVVGRRGGTVSGLAVRGRAYVHMVKMRSGGRAGGMTQGAGRLTNRDGSLIPLRGRHGVIFPILVASGSGAGTEAVVADSDTAAVVHGGEEID